MHAPNLWKTSERTEGHFNYFKIQNSKEWGQVEFQNTCSPGIANIGSERIPSQASWPDSTYIPLMTGSSLSTKAAFSILGKFFLALGQSVLSWTIYLLFPLSHRSPQNQVPCLLHSPSSLKLAITSCHCYSSAGSFLNYLKLMAVPGELQPQ